jgi:glutamate formiminotransferase / formiminotetrahydrofolate cyclodeaminase
MRYVKALGLLVEGRAQVSMNLTNYHDTPVARVVEMIRREAERYGTGIHHCELVGLIPEEALVEAAVWYLQLDQFEGEQILERKLYSAAQVDESEANANPSMGGEAFLDALAAGTAAPGGGSAAAYSGAAGAALVAMVARLTIGKKKYASVEAEMQRLLEQAEALRLELTESVKRDAAAFEALMAAFKLPRETPDDQGIRAQAIEEATLIAKQEPLKTVRMAVQVMELGQQVVQVGNLNAITDAGTGVALARAALAGAGLNVRTNLKSLQNQAAVSQIALELNALEAKGSELETGVRNTLQERGGLAFV